MYAQRVSTEGDELYFEVRGNGRPVLMIPGGGGDGGAYTGVAERLRDEFKVITYDRRAGGRSTMNSPGHFDISQQSRDAVAVLRAAGETSAAIFGNSSGAVIALDIAAREPQAVDAIVAHEPPLARVHPDAEKWEAFFQSVYRTRARFSRALAMIRFMLGIGTDFAFVAAMRAMRAARKQRAASSVPYLDRRKIIDFFITQELLPVTNYVPDLEALKRIREKLFLAAGRRSLEKKRFYAETAQILAERLGCRMVVFPGHHGSFVDMPDAWTAALRQALTAQRAAHLR